MRTIKKTVLLFAALLFAVTLGIGVFTACDQKDGLGKDTAYSVSVEYPDGKGVSGVTVTFSIGEKEYGSAKTDANGTATATLRAGEYAVTLSDLPEGYDYETGVTTNRSGTPLSISLIRRLTDYSATVSLPDGTKAEGVTVVWSKDGAVAGEAETDENGVASKQLPAGTYSVTVKNEPEGYWLENPLTASEQSPSLSILLQVDTRLLFTVTAETTGGMKLRNVSLFVLEGTSTVAEATTAKDGTASFRLPEGEYSLLTSTSAAGFTAAQSSYELNKDNTEVTVKFNSSVITDKNVPASKKYVLGDIMYDFIVTPYNDPETKIQLSELLKSKKMVMINFWYTTCSWCIKEFPALETAYEEYKDEIEVVAVNAFYPAENETTIFNFLQQYSTQFQLTFPVVCDTNKLSGNFNIQGYPTSVFIDRYGAVARIESGGIVYPEVWLQLFEEFTADDYTQTFTPGDEVSEPEEFVPDIPDVEMPASSEIEAAINNTGTGCNFTYYPEKDSNDAKYAWPFLVAEKNGKSAIKPANSGYRSSYSMIHSDMELKAGDVVAFDFFSSCEDTDILYVLIDGLVMWQISGTGKDWETCYAYVAIRDGTYKLSLLYKKDSTANVGDDAVYVTNMRILTEQDVTTTTDILRHCATDMNADGTAYENYVTPVKGEDGYYRVGTQDGPYILADLFHSTNWNTKSVYQLYAEKAEAGQKFMYDLDGKGVKDCTALLVEYLSISIKSDCYGMVPVDETLKKLLDAITNEYSENHHEQEWLEICKYFSRYGAEGEYPFPIWGVNMNTAISIQIGETITFKTDRIVRPVNSLMYKFTPDKDGVYYLHSLVPKDKEDFQTQAWLYTEENYEDENAIYSGDDLLGTTDPDDGVNFWIYAELKAGATYYLECAFYWNDDSTVGQTFDFKVEYVGEYAEVLTAGASGMYTTSGSDLSGPTILSYAIDTVLYEGKYYYKNADGTRGNVIYIDIEQPTRANGLMTLKEIAKSFIDKDKKIHALDFTQQRDENGKVLPEKYNKDFTQQMVDIIKEAEAKTEAFDKRFVEATEELVTILTAYAKVNLFGIDEAWLQFAYYYHEYGTKPVEPETPPEAVLPEGTDET